MPQKASSGAVFERRYRDLVRLAYLVLPGKGRRVYRLALAQRIVDGEFPLAWARSARPGTGRYGYARMRTRVLRRAMQPSWRLRVGLGPWLRGLPTRLPDPALTLALAELDAPVRVAYVLRQVEKMPRYAVRDQLVELGVPDARAVLQAAESLDGLPAACSRIAEVTVDVSFRRACDRAVRRRSRVPIAVATALTVVLAGTVFVLETGPASSPAEARRARLVKVPPRAWDGASRTFDVWPARGELVADQAFLDRALAAWVRRTGHGGDAQLLYAGRIDGTSTALLRHGDRIGRYTEPGRTLRDLPMAGRVPSGPLDLGGGYYLLPPWTTEAHSPDGRPIAARQASAASGSGKDAPGRKETERRASARTRPGKDGKDDKDASGKDAPNRKREAENTSAKNSSARDSSGRKTPVKDASGKEEPAKNTPSENASSKNASAKGTPGKKASAQGGSHRSAPAAGASRLGMENPLVGPLTARTPCRRGPLLRLRDHRGSAMLADLGGPALTTVRHRSPADDAPRAVTPGSAELDLWERLACALPASTPARPVTEATAWELWSGRLPDQTRPARWVCTRYTYADGGTSTHATLFEPGGRHHDAGPCDDPRRPVSGMWWRSPRRHWYYLATTVPGAVPHAAGPIESATRRGRLLVATGPKPQQRPTGRMTLTTRKP